jgi:amino acid adenylation domain-containing protein
MDPHGTAAQPDASRDTARRASFAQERFWFLDQMDPGSPVFTVPAQFYLTGPLDVPALKRSLQEVVNRHEALRTTFAMIDGQLVQVVAPALAVALPVVDRRDLPEGERRAEAWRWVAAEAQRSFDLDRGPLLRAMLLRLGEEEHVLFLNMHHIISDGWSIGVLTRELSILYQAFSAGRPSPLPDLPIQYADFAERQRQSAERNELAEQLEYWKRELGGDLPELALPTDRARPAIQTFRGAAETLTLPGPLSRSLVALSQREHVSLFMTLLAAFQTLLHRYTGQDCIAVGAPFAERGHEELEGLIGCFLNVLVLRTNLAGNPTFRELLARVRLVILQAHDHRAAPFQQLVEALRPERDLSRPPLVQVFFNMLNFQHGTLSLPGLEVERLPPPEIGSMHDITVYAEEHAAGIRLRLVYNPDLFNPDTIARMLRHFQTLLEAVVADIEQPVSALPLLTPRERHHLLVECNNTRAAYPVDACLPELVTRQVERTPDATAVVFEDAALTYRELNRRANQLAHHLRALGVGPEMLVGICVERSLELVIALLAVLKAGGAYLPLDPTYPRQRLAFLLGDARPGILLTQAGLADTLPAYAGPAICVDRDRDNWERERMTDPAVPLAADNLAYVIYTSGSTGRPKGVQVTHRGVVNYLTFLAKTYELGPADVVLQLTSISFDPSVRDIFGPLTTGARLVLMKDAEVLDPLALLAAIRARRATRILASTPSMLRPLVAAACEESVSLESLRTILVGGEPLRAADVTGLRQLAGGALIVNHYGPTECTMTSTCYAVSPADASRSLVPAGRPIDNVQLYILDRYLNPVPIGVAGEVHIGGVGVARGYLNRPELTAQRFIPHPFSDEPGARLYKTGDVGRYLPDGTLELLGRRDEQVKVRGIRVELGEIEAVLCEHAGVREAAVAAWEDGPDDRRLAAYVVARSAPAPERHELRRFLQDRLPGYMVPADFVMMDALPLTPTRKVDRRALHRPDRVARERDRTFAAPRTMVEEALAGMWAEVLGLDRVGIHDDFFELGGHSLMVGRLLSAVRKRFHVGVSMRAFFTAPTVEALALAIVQELAGRAEAGTMESTLQELRALSDEDARRLVGEAAK